MPPVSGKTTSAHERNITCLFVRFQSLLQAKENGAITVSTVHTDDGSPDQLVFEFNFHKEQIVLLDFLSSSTFISMGEDGNGCITDFTTGKQVAGIKVGDDFKAALSPDKQVLFVLKKGDKKDRHVKKHSLPGLEEIATLTPDIGRFYVPFTKLFGVSADVCLLQYLYHELGDNPVQEIVGIADFSKNSLVVKEFEKTIVSDFNRDKVPFAIHPASGTGVRLDFNQPIELTDEVYCTIKAELFDIYTLQTKKYVSIGRLKREAENVASFRDHAFESEEYQEAVEDFYKAILALRFSPDGKTLWASYSMGALSAVDLESGERTRYMVNAGGTQKGVPNLNSIFGLSMYNNTILNISSDQRYVVFSYPNCFVPFDLPFQEGEWIHKIVPRQLASGEGVTEEVSFGGFTRDGKYIVTAHEAGYIFVIDAATGKQRYKVAEPYIAGVSDVDHADGMLSVAVSGSNAYYIGLEENEEVSISELFVPPHTLATQFIEPKKVVFIHHNGAVVMLSEEFASMDVHFIGEPFKVEANQADGEQQEGEEDMEEEEYEEHDAEAEDGSDEEEDDDDESDDQDDDNDNDDEDEDEESGPREFYDYFDQHIPTFGGAFFNQNGMLKAATINEDGDIHVYSLNGEVKYEYEQSSGESYDYNTISASPSYLVVGNYSDYRTQGYTLFKIEEDGISEVEKVKDKALRFFCLKEQENTLFRFNQQTGAFTQTALPAGKSTTLFTYDGPKISFIKYNEATGKLLFAEGGGRIHLIDLQKKTVQYSWELKSLEDDKEFKQTDTETKRFRFS